MRSRIGTKCGKLLKLYGGSFPKSETVAKLNTTLRMQQTLNLKRSALSPFSHSLVLEPKLRYHVNIKGTI